MWRTLVSPFIHKQAGIVRASSGSCRRLYFFSSESGNKGISTVETTGGSFPRTVTDQNSVSRVDGVIVQLLGHPSNSYNKTSHLEASSLIQIILKDTKNRYHDGADKNELTLCVPNNERKGRHSGFGFGNTYLDIEKWCYGVFVVSSLISWRKLLFNDDTWKNDILLNAHRDSSLHILPVNGPAKPIDPADAAFSSFENAVSECTAVTQNALAIKLSSLNLHKKALAYFKSASNKGNVAAHYNLGQCYEKGMGTTKDMTKAVNSYMFAAKQGHLEASYNLGRIYLEGKHVREEKSEGLNFMEKAARGGLSKAQRFLGLYYADDSGKHYDMRTSAKWLQFAADQNDSTAQYHLGICYEKGFGVSRNMRQAKELYRQAAENGHPGGQFNYGVFLEHGLGGLSVDRHEALTWYSLASDSGNVNAKQNLEYIKKELHDRERVREKPSLLQRLLPDSWKLHEPIAGDSSAGILPRCSSSPGRLHMTTGLETSHDSERSHTQPTSFDDKKCIWVI